MQKEYDNIDAYQGFLKGNLFNDLYVPYKNYDVEQLNPKDEKSYDMLLVQIYYFAVHDLDLYLDIHSDDESAIKLRNDYYKMYKEAKEKFERKYYYLCLDSDKLVNVPWAWTENYTFPWKGDML